MKKRLTLPTISANLRVEEFGQRNYSIEAVDSKYLSVNINKVFIGKI